MVQSVDISFIRDRIKGDSKIHLKSAPSETKSDTIIEYFLWSYTVNQSAKSKKIKIKNNMKKKVKNL